MTRDEERELREQLARLQQEHRDLDVAISALQHSPGSDLLQVQRLKKRKLVLRDRIAHIEDELTPDIIACESERRRMAGRKKETKVADGAAPPSPRYSPAATPPRFRLRG